MHLTNYSTSSTNSDELDDEEMRKGDLKFLFGRLRDQNHDPDKLWAEIKVGLV